MPYAPWFARDPDRFAYEQKELAERAPSLQLDRCALERGFARYRGRVEIGARAVDVEIVYPSEFPEFPPEILAHDLALGRHQNPIAKNLCTIARTVEEWRGNESAADVLLRAIELVQTMEKGPAAIYEAEEDAPQPYSTFYPTDWHASILVPEEAVPDVPVGAYGRFWLRQRPPIDGHFQGLLARVEIMYPEPSRTFECSAALQRMFPHALEGNGYWYRSASRPVPQSSPESMLRALDQDHPELPQRLSDRRFQVRIAGRREDRTTGDFIGVVFDEDGPRRGETHARWLIGSRKGLTRDRESFLFDTEPLAINDLAARIPSVQELRDKHVLFAGLGTLGSRTIFDMAESLLGQFTIVDPDRLLPHNIVRHICGLEYLGFTKTEALEQVILNHFPWARVHCMFGRIGAASPDNPEESLRFMRALYDAIERVDLLVDSTAEHSVSWSLNRLACELGKPIVFAWVSAGTWGGHVLRYIPGETGCYECLGLWNRDEPPSDPDARPIFTQGCGYPSFAGTSFDIGATASAAARLAVQTLLRANVGAYPDSVRPGIVLGHRLDQPRPDVPFVTLHEIPQHPNCRVCR